jgi:hypothetical protein
LWRSAFSFPEVFADTGVQHWQCEINHIAL